MADWYVSSAAYTAIAAFVPSAVYTVGNIVKPTAPVAKALYVFRCTTAGTAGTEPTWPASNNATIVTGGATFTNVTGTGFGWAAATGDLATMMPSRPALAGGDRVFVASDHTETQATTTEYGAGTNGSLVCLILSVNRAGSVPPVAADLLAGASVTVSTAGNLQFSHGYPIYYYGISFVCTATATVMVTFGNGGNRTLYFDNCLFWTNTASGLRMQANGICTTIFNNTPFRFNNASSFIRGDGNWELIWQNTPSAILGTAPTQLFIPGTVNFIARGVDLSAITGTLIGNSGSNQGRHLFDSCRIAPGVIRLSTGGTTPRDIVELVNCFDGTNIISESWQTAGAVTTEFTIVLTGGATDNVGLYSHKMVTTTLTDKYCQPLNSFWMDTNNTTIGTPRTATVEIVSSASLNNDEISLTLEYLGTAGSSLATIVDTLPVTVLTTPTAVTTSTATWNSLPATPVKQRLSVTFTPLTAGRVRGQVQLGKPSTTVYVNPQLTIS